jgi:ABC-2 type transport system ATP-binding protein
MLASHSTVAIRAEGLTKVYGRIRAVDGVSFEVATGTAVALLGPNGAGKTTLVSMLTTIARPTAGKAWVEGYEVSKDEIAVRRTIGVVPQMNNLDRYLTARENLVLHAMMHGMPKSEFVSRIDELLEFMGLGERGDDFPDTFSGGMMRRLVFARALVHNPKVLFLDEPTTGLDPQSRRTVWDEIARFKGKATIFLTTHNMEEAERLADRIMVMDEGRILVDGTAAELKARVKHSETYLLYLRTNAECYAPRLRALPEVEDLRVDDSLLEVRLRKGTHLTRLMAIFDSGDVLKVTEREPSLEDVFLELTGRRIRE